MDAFSEKPFTQKLTIFLIILNLITMAALWYVVFRRPPGGRPPREVGKGQDVQSFLRRELNLSDEQAAAFANLRDRFLDTARPLHDEIRKSNEATLTELLKAQADQRTIETLTARIGTLRGEEEKLLFLHFQELMAVCRPDQKIKFQSIMREFLVMIGFFEASGAPRNSPPPQDRRGGPPPQDRRNEPPQKLR
ncbi:MAG: periplasmic heavy metal sensor [Candidatus Aminicenantes bacterium]|nr:periplasmic heavy metal sensor [Candidatus Aminicenantes bacterium]